MAISSCEGSTAMQQITACGILKERPSSKLWTSDYRHDGYLTGVPCVKGEYAPRINGVL
jgi:hypothetical protein